MKIHKDITNKGVLLALGALTESGDKDAPIVVTPGTYHGRPATVVALMNDGGGLLPMAVVLDLEGGDAAYMTIDGTVSPVTPPAAPTVDDPALAVLRDVARTTGPLAERAQRVLEGRMTPKAPDVLSTGLYL